MVLSVALTYGKIYYPQGKVKMHLFKAKIFSFFVVFFCCTCALALPPEWPEDGIIVEPDMNRTPLIAAFKDAKKSLQISAYKLTDKALIEELGKAAQRGVKVDILVTRDIFKREGEIHPDETPLTLLKEMKINVNQSPEFYAQAHYKLIIVDGLYALIGTGNMCKGSFDDSPERKAERDFWMTVTDNAYLQELTNVFKADFNGVTTDLKASLLVWSPDQGRTPFIKLINSAKKNIWVYQQDIEDPEIANALAAAARKKIDVRLMMTPFPFNKAKDGNAPNQEIIRQAGGKVGFITDHVVIHAKVMLVDVGEESSKVWLGSTNFYPPSLNNNRELGIITSHAPAIDTISSVFKKDWGQANFDPHKL
jgi:cardiolipin synthase